MEKKKKKGIASPLFGHKSENPAGVFNRTHESLSLWSVRLSLSLFLSTLSFVSPSSCAGLIRENLNSREREGEEQGDQSTLRCHQSRSRRFSFRDPQRFFFQFFFFTQKVIEWRLTDPWPPLWSPTLSSQRSHDGRPRLIRPCRISTLPDISSTTCTGKEDEEKKTRTSCWWIRLGRLVWSVPLLMAMACRVCCCCCAIYSLDCTTSLAGAPSKITSRVNVVFSPLFVRQGGRSRPSCARSCTTSSGSAKILLRKDGSFFPGR